MQMCVYSVSDPEIDDLPFTTRIDVVICRLHPGKNGFIRSRCCFPARNRLRFVDPIGIHGFRVEDSSLLPGNLLGSSLRCIHLWDRRYSA